MKLHELYCQESLHLLDAATKKIEHCLNQLSNDQIWWRPANDANSIGNLLLHMSGNLRQWGVIPISGEADLRDRDAEFAQRDPVSREELLATVNQTIADAKTQIRHLNEHQLLEKKQIQGFNTTLLGAISHTTSHFVGHTHQIILLTRMQLGDNYRFEWTDESHNTDASDVPI